MTDKKHAELFSFCSPESIVVVTWYGKLKELYCPFGVKVISTVGTLSEGSYQQVDKVILASNGKTVFVIDGKNYFYHYFDILTHLTS